MAALRPRSLVAVFAIVAVAAVVTACPGNDDDPQPDVEGDATNDVTNDVTEDTQPLPDAIIDADFGQVAQILRLNCATALCHGQGGPGLSLQIPNYEQASDEDIRQALEGVEATTGRLLIEPGRPEDSELYIVLITDDITRRMPPPPFDPLPLEQVALIHDWIARGAEYE
jgi:hypothetical protein